MPARRTLCLAVAAALHLHLAVVDELSLAPSPPRFI